MWANLACPRREKKKSYKLLHRDHRSLRGPKTGASPEAEVQLVKFIEDVRSRGHAVSTEMAQVEARRLSKELGLPHEFHGTESGVVDYMQGAYELISERVRDVFLTSYSGGEDSLRFLLSLFVLFGMFLLIVYTGFGMSALPMRLVLGERSAAREVADVGERRRALRTQLDSLARHGGGSNRQRSARLEEQLHSLDERQHRLEDFRDSCTYRLRFLIRPLQIVLGVVFALLGLLLWTSLLLSNVDKAMHSLGFHMGYLLEHPELPNPLDVTLVWLQRWGASILDSALILALLLLLIACSTYGLQRIGIWCLFLQMYRLRMGRARPQAVVLLCMALVFVALALNVLLHSACPQYSTYGSQRYQGINGTQPCDAQALPDDCVMSRGSAMLESFFFKAWIFGAAFYWATWLFIGSVVISFLVVVIRGRQSSVEVDADEFEDDDDDDEPLIRA
ncbi:hypothetical protein HPB51_026753 [Rhipicephalus microplus]|uniref:LMBR1 domain-containing protein 1 n=1 Tax=Rhipicephalus microplus TaxID=6941 RepID=A0A9J6D296_RHIMP|nr:hypothetical protein HPB51_026753 [Rhipicephalus microplus]